MKEPDWERAYQRLLKETQAAIRRFAQEHPNVIVSDFWYDSEPCYGYVLIGINSLDSARRSAREIYDYHISYRRKLLTDDLDTWLDNAVYQLRVHSVKEAITNSGVFEFSQYAKIDFPEWQECAESDDYPDQPDYQDDYLECRAAYLFWRTFETLVEQDAFSPLQLASPARLGFAFHEGSANIMHLLNWNNPSAEQGSAGQSAPPSEST